MTNLSFKFKQFTIYHDKCAMKVGTDGVLLGAWAPVANAKRVLDVGTGTGLIALQLAQRNSDAKITAIEIDIAAAKQARDNVLHSSWADRIEVVCIDFRNYQSEDKFDLIVSNPPYFINALKCPNKQRCVARHTEDLNYNLLFSRAAHLLCDQGVISIIIPSEAEKLVLDTAWNHKLLPLHRMRVFTKPEKPCRRVLLTFGFQNKECIEENICIEVNHNEFTPEYIALTKDFYLKL
ncbi:tRNA1(Val) (adenine(37)-N6)-methyltransferase [Bacteroides helcogenes]|uniref:tRNA1(Val) (adenine(37)-N6)-methyltransferase n=1 Tax=Bacteroides helcogenes (strain ATCC 35417 / DSM 20613 / JCM 6297 / CCUG 15421 / P 36-108) TaxID=693979 RepID=E6STP2_BACT6|nr:methyltransferase [Bacteroides helcogenes]ADV44289.1 methyltransferase small [Bacteroides helcogenes P 36-108]MDY5238298.1 methyltransferase [Bacteroides helcogenes]